MEHNLSKLVSDLPLTEADGHKTVAAYNAALLLSPALPASNCARALKPNT